VLNRSIEIYRAAERTIFWVPNILLLENFDFTVLLFLAVISNISVFCVKSQLSVLN